MTKLNMALRKLEQKLKEQEKLHKKPVVMHNASVRSQKPRPVSGKMKRTS